jgi:hypothetical protein
MNEAKPKRCWFRFSIRDLLWLTALAAVFVVWWLDHQRLSEQIESLKSNDTWSSTSSFSPTQSGLQSPAVPSDAK